MNISNYALMLEKKAHGYLHVNEAADMQTADGLAKLLSGQNGGSYAKQWNQFMDQVESKKAAGSYTFMVKHDNGKDMINVAYQIGKDLKPLKGSLKLAEESVASGGNNNATALVHDQLEVEKKMIEFSKAIQACFATNAAGDTGGDMFAEFLGNWNDDDTGAAAYFKTWAEREIYATLWKIKGAANLFTDEYQKSVSIENIDSVHKAISTIHGKMTGNGDSDNTVVWKIAKLDKSYERFSADTDIG